MGLRIDSYHPAYWHHDGKYLHKAFGRKVKELTQGVIHKVRYIWVSSKTKKREGSSRPGSGRPDARVQFALSLTYTWPQKISYFQLPKIQSLKLHRTQLEFLITGASGLGKFFALYSSFRLNSSLICVCGGGGELVYLVGCSMCNCAGQASAHMGTPVALRWQVLARLALRMCKCWCIRSQMISLREQGSRPEEVECQEKSY